MDALAESTYPRSLQGISGVSAPLSFSSFRQFTGQSAHDKTCSVFEMTLAQPVQEGPLSIETKIVVKIQLESAASKNELKVHALLSDTIPNETVQLYAAYNGALKVDELVNGLSPTDQVAFKAALPKGDRHTVMWMEAMTGTLDDRLVDIKTAPDGQQRTDAEIDEIVDRIFTVSHSKQEVLLKHGLFDTDDALRNMGFRATGKTAFGAQKAQLLIKALDFGATQEKRVGDEETSGDSTLSSAITSRFKLKVRRSTRSRENHQHTETTPITKLGTATSRLTPHGPSSAARVLPGSQMRPPEGSLDGFGAGAEEDSIVKVFDFDEDDARSGDGTAAARADGVRHFANIGKDTPSRPAPTSRAARAQARRAARFTDV